MKKLTQWYLDQIKTNKLVFDQSQLVILQQLEKFIDNFYKHTRWYKRWYRPKIFGCYIYGDVGRGKSMIMDALFAHIHTHKKLRIHFHEFMKIIQHKLSNMAGDQDRINLIAKELAKKYHIICLDEMHISDIANAMILKSLFVAMFRYNIYVITTSNYIPNDLYFDGLHRDRFLPTIALIKKKLMIICLNSQKDYRLINTHLNQLFFIKSHKAIIELNNLFEQLSGDVGVVRDSAVMVCNRYINYIAKSDSVIWFDFSVICGDNRSQLDYIELVNSYDWIIISGVKSLAPDQKNIARRFTLLIDIIYDNNTKLALESNCRLVDIYLSGEFKNEFSRTISRLNEMQTVSYLSKVNRVLGVVVNKK